MIQFNEIIYQLSRKLNWEVQVAALSAGNKLDNKYNPLVVNPDDARARVRRERGVKHEDQESLESFEVRLRAFVN